MKKKWNILAYILAVALVAGGLLALWLPNRNTEDTEPGETVADRPDTDPNAPFEDLSAWEKEKVLAAVAACWGETSEPGPDAFFWYGDPKPGQETSLTGENYMYGVQYYGTFGGYHIILSPKRAAVSMPSSVAIGEYRFEYGDYFKLLAYKDGVAWYLGGVYKNGLLSDEQIGQIYQCYIRYSQEIYTRKAWEEHEGKN